MSKYKVTNGEYLEFVRAGAKPPHFWTWREGQWRWRAMSRRQCRYRWIGRSMSPMRRRAPLQPGPERDCPPKPSFIGPRMGRGDGEEERSYPWGDDLPDSRAGKLRREPMGSYSRDGDPAWRQRIRNFPTGRQRMGVDVDGLPAFSRIPTPLVLSRILSTLLRWRPLCAQRGVLADRRQICCADRFATGSGPTTPMSMPDFGAWRTKPWTH